MLDHTPTGDPPAWKFRRMHAGEMNIDPIESEFFSTEALDSLADALVREAIQNSLDARAPGTQARVRIAFSGPGPGTLRRFVHVLQQLDVTYDVYGMSGRAILDLLPSEFDAWRERSRAGDRKGKGQLSSEERPFPTTPSLRATPP